MKRIMTILLSLIFILTASALSSEERLMPSKGLQIHWFSSSEVNALLADVDYSAQPPVLWELLVNVKRDRELYKVKHPITGKMVTAQTIVWNYTATYSLFLRIPRCQRTTLVKVVWGDKVWEFRTAANVRSIYRVSVEPLSTVHAPLKALPQKGIKIILLDDTERVITVPDTAIDVLAAFVEGVSQKLSKVDFYFATPAGHAWEWEKRGMKRYLEYILAVEKEYMRRNGIKWDGNPDTYPYFNPEWEQWNWVKQIRREIYK